MIGIPYAQQVGMASNAASTAGYGRKRRVGRGLRVAGGSVRREWVCPSGWFSTPSHGRKTSRGMVTKTFHDLFLHFFTKTYIFFDINI
jgi:hypothetical protein